MSQQHVLFGSYPEELSRRSPFPKPIPVPHPSENECRTDPRIGSLSGKGCPSILLLWEKSLKESGARAGDSSVLRRITGMIGGRHKSENGIVSHKRALHPIGIFRIHRCNFSVRKGHGKNRAKEKDLFQMHGIFLHGVTGKLQPHSGGCLGAGTGGPEGNGLFLLVRHIWNGIFYRL